MGRTWQLKEIAVQIPISWTPRDWVICRWVLDIPAKRVKKRQKAQNERK
jgi:hypothetical protein